MQTIRIYNQDIRMEIDIEMCAMVIMRSGKRGITGGTEQIRKASECFQRN